MPSAVSLRPRRVMASPFPAGVAMLEPVHQPLYSAIALDAAVAPREVVAFQYGLGGAVAGAGAGAVANATFWHTNLEQPNALANPKTFLIQGVRIVPGALINAVGIVADPSQAAANVASNAIDDLVRMIWSSFFKLYIGTKDYIRVPTFLLPGNTGIEGAAAIGTTSATASYMRIQGVYNAGKYFGMPNFPINLAPMQTFNATLSWPQATPPTIAATHLLWVVLDGISGRESQ